MRIAKYVIYDILQPLCARVYRVPAHHYAQSFQPGR